MAGDVVAPLSEGEAFAFDDSNPRFSNNDAVAFPDNGTNIMTSGVGLEARGFAAPDLIGDTYFEIEMLGRSNDNQVEIGINDPTDPDNPDAPYYFTHGLKWRTSYNDQIRVVGRFEETFLRSLAMLTTGQTARFCVKKSTHEFWCAVEDEAWNGDPSAVPGTSGGFDLGDWPQFNIHISIQGAGANGDGLRINARASTWKYTAPSGFAANRA